MANRRMFSLDVVDTDKFLDMPISAQCLYFHLGMRADDDGFISSPKQIMRMASCSQGDIRALIENGYVIPFESGIVVIRHWKQNNYIRPDRYNETRHIAEKQQIEQRNGVYELPISGIPSDNQMTYQWDTQVSIDKNSIDKDSINTICSEPKDSEPNKTVELSGILIPLNNKTFYDVPLEDITLWRDTYPAVDIEGELRRMIAWLNSNPTKRKTSRGVRRFINSWLARTQDNGGSRTQKGEKATSGNNAYDTDAEWNRIKGILKETGTDTDRRQDAPFA